jgi:hypothetical protein
MPGFRGIGFDPFYLTDLFIRLEAELNLGAGRWSSSRTPTRSSFMVPACQAFYTAVMDKSVTHDGDGRLAQHVRNAVLKEDRHGPRIVKEAKGSPRKIDLAVCAVGAGPLPRVLRPMKRAAAGLRRCVTLTASLVGLEGALLLAGTCALAVASTYVSPAGPWFVVGVICILAALGLAFPRGGADRGRVGGSLGPPRSRRGTTPAG